MNKLSKIIISLCLVLGSGVALAEAFGSSGGVSSGLVCLLSGGTGCTFSGGSIDITAASNQDLTIAAAGTGSVQIGGGDASIDLIDSSNVARGNILVNASGIITYSSTNQTNVFTSANRTSSSVAVNIGDSTSKVQVYGEGMIVIVPTSALSLATPTDTTISPVSSNASSHCRMSSAGVSAWTPQETSAVDGAFYCCTNTGANVITMTESAGVYEGPAVASALGQFDTVCMEYVTDRWVQRDFSDN